MTQDLDTIDLTPVLVQRAAGLPATDEGWTEVRHTSATSLRRGVGNDFGSATILMHWGKISDPNDLAVDMETPLPQLDIDDCVRLRLTSIEKDEIVWGDTLWHGVVESIDDSDPKRSSVKAVDLAVLLARVYNSRGLELADGDALLVDPGFLPAFNAIPGGDRSASPWPDEQRPGETYHVHDRRGTGVPWSAFDIAKRLLIRAMRPDLPGAAGRNAILWRLDAASVGDYTPDTLDFNGISIAECMDRLFGSKRGLTWRVTVADGFAQVRVCDLAAAGTPLDTEADLGWDSPQIQRRRDGYDYVLVTGARPLVGMTLWWTRGASGGSLEPDGWDPATAGAALDAALQDEISGKPYDRPEWRRFRLRAAWDGAQYDGTPGGSTTHGLRNLFWDSTNDLPPDGDRTWSPPIPPPASLTIEREGPAGQGFTSTATGPRQAPIVIAGKTGTWVDLSTSCRPTPIGGKLSGERNDQGTIVLVLGESAADADLIRQAIGNDGTLLITIGIREWAPVQCAWTAPPDSCSQLSPRVYHLRRPGIEEWLCLPGCVKGLASDGTLSIEAGQIAVRSDIAQLQTIRDQLVVRFGRAITAASIVRQSEILTTWQPGDVCSDLTLVDGRSYPLDMPLAEITYDFTRWTTTLRWAPLIKETPSA